MDSGSFVKISDENFPSMKGLDYSLNRPLDQVLQHFKDNNLYTDVTFKVHCGDGFISFSCHKLVLSLWSPVFAKKFYNQDSRLESEIIDVSDVPPSAFEIIIKYCYGTDTDLRKYRHDVEFLLKACKGALLYQINGLHMLCCEMLSCALPTIENVFELLEAASFIKSESLKLRCYKVLQTKTQQVIESRGINDISRSVINKILEMSSLSFRSEYELITWLFEWAGREASKHEGVTVKDMMLPFLPQINFLALEPKEFGLLVSAHKEFFNENEGFAIFMNIVCPESSWPLPSWCNKELSRTFIDGGLVSM